MGTATSGCWRPRGMPDSHSRRIRRGVRTGLVARWQPDRLWLDSKGRHRSLQASGPRCRDRDAGLGVPRGQECLRLVVGRPMDRVCGPDPTTARDLWALPMAGEKKPIAVASAERNGRAVLAGRPMGRVPVERERTKRSLRASLSRTRAQVADSTGGGMFPSGRERKSAVLSGLSQPRHERARRAEWREP